MSQMQKPQCPAFRRRPLNLAVLAACAALAQPTGAATIEFTGLAPVYTASWYNGTSTEFHEFQYFLDWQGYCNAHFGAQCAATTFWGVPFNWDLNRLPTATDHVHTPVGSVVVVSSYSSVYKGGILGLGSAGSLTADGQIRLGLSSLLSVGNGFITDLSLGGGTLESNGLVTVNNLSGALGSLQGTGTTQVMAAPTPTLSNLLIKSGHTLEFYGQYGGIFGGSFGSTGPLLEPGTGNVFNPGIPGARLINYGTLDGANVMLQGSANLATVPRLINRGTLIGGFNPHGVRVDNEGMVSLGAGGAMSFGPAGTHTGSFTAGTNSVLTFGGPWGHELLPGSSLSSSGKVVFQGGVHKVRGGFDAFETELQGGGGNAYLDFSGSSVHIDTLRVDAGFGELRFLTAAGVNLQELALNSGKVIFDTGTAGAQPLSTIQTLAMTGGTLTANSPVELVNPFQWNAGSLSGSGGVTALGGIEINGAGALGLFGLLRNPGTTNWNGGFINWGGTFENLAGATFNVHGDFSAGSGGVGRFVNAGTVVKTASSGVASLGMAFDNNGLVKVQTGTLRLTGGGNHDGGRFEASPGALIELSGNTVMKGNIVSLGRVNVTGGNLSLSSGASYYNLPGNSVNVSNLGIGALAGFVNDGNLNVSGTLDNQGFFTHKNALPAASVGAVINSGNVINLGGALNVLGDVTNSGTFNNLGGDLNVLGNVANSKDFFNNSGRIEIAGGLNSSGSFRNDGAGSVARVAGGPSLIGGSFVNEGSLAFLGGDVTFAGLASNLGQIYNGGGNFTVLAGASLTNQGTMTNDYGTVFVDTGGYLGGSGAYVQTGGLTWIRGTLQAGAGIDIQGGILRGGTPPGSPPGIGTVLGHVELHGQDWRWEPGNSPGTFTVVGDVTIQGTAGRPMGQGNIEIEFASPSEHDRIVISGTLTLYEASIDLVFAPGFSALDGDSLAWLSAGQVILPNGPGAVTFNFSGLSADWAATPAFGTNGVSLEMVNLLATPIPTLGSHTVGAGGQAYNGSWANLYNLTVEGSLSNRAGGTLLTGGLNVASGGRLLNRETIEVRTQATNAGELINRYDGQFWHNGLLNTGRLVNEGQFSGFGDLVNQGRMINSGQLSGWRFTNAAGAQFTNTGALTHEGLFANQAGSRFENRGSMTANGRIENLGEFIVSGTLQNNASSFGPAYYTGSILNTEGGTFTVEAGGSVSGPGTYFQRAFPDSVTRVNGTLAASDITIRGGVLTGDGTLVGPVTLGSGATVQPGNSPGTLTVDGNLDAYHTTFDIELAGPALYDRVVVTGDAQFTGGLVNFLLRTQDGITYDYRPAPGDSFTWLTVLGAVDGLSGLNWTLTVVGDGWSSPVAASSWGDNEWIWGPGPSDGVSIAFYGDRIEFSAAPVPEPESYAMMLAGLGLVGWAVRRRRPA